jgi:hypothetical protein
MCIQLIADLIRLKANGETRPVQWIDFEKVMPAEIRYLLMTPATNDLAELYDVPLHPLLNT